MKMQTIQMTNIANISSYITERLLTVKQKSFIYIKVRQIKQETFISKHSKKRTRTLHKPTANKMKYD
jgi:hypothetical protein